MKITEEQLRLSRWMCGACIVTLLAVGVIGACRDDPAQAFVGFVMACLFMELLCKVERL